MRVLVFLGVIGIVGLLLQQYSRWQDMQSQLARLQHENTELRAGKERIAAQGKKLNDETTALHQQFRSQQQVARNSDQDRDGLLQQLASLQSRLAAEERENGRLRALLVQNAQPGRDDVAAAQRVKAIDDQQSIDANRQLSRRARIDELKVRAGQLSARQQAVFDNLHYKLEHGEKIDSELLKLAQQSPVMQDLLSVYGLGESLTVPESTMARFQRVYADASAEEKKIADQLMGQVKAGTSLSELLADPYLRREAEKSALMQSIVDLAKQRDQGAIVFPR